MQLGVPKDIIERNMRKATDKDQADFTEVSNSSLSGVLHDDTSVQHTMARNAKSMVFD